MVTESKIIKIDRIFYINLDRRPDRDKHIRTELSKHNQNKNQTLLDITERVSAVDGSRLDLDDISKNIITSEGITAAKNKTNMEGISLTPGAIGCAMSHRNIWLRIKNDPNIDNALILEDDIDLDKNFISKLIDYQNITIPYDILFLGYHPATIKYIQNKSNIAKKVYGLFGYIVTKKGANKLLKIFPITRQIDTELSESFGKFNINVIILGPDQRIITSEPSEIATTFGTDIQTKTNNINIIEPYTSDMLPVYFFYILVTIILTILIILLINTIIDPKSAEV